VTKASVDILLAVYNGERFLRPFLDSLQKQTFRDFRLVASNNKSGDRTQAILDEFREADRLVMLPPPGKLLSAHDNFARVTEAADASYIMYADADDVWREDKIEKTLAAMRTAERKFGATNPILVHSDLKVVDENLHCLAASFWRYQYIDPSRTAVHQLLLQNCVTGCTTMLNRPLFELGRPIPAEACVHDHWYALVASAFGHIVAVSEALIEYRQHGHNVTGAKKWGAPYVMNRARHIYSEGGARETIAGNFRQAEVFLSRFKSRLDPAQKEVIGNFAAIRQQGALGRRWSLVRNRFWKAGLARNVGLLLAI
jgi:glycosyltransferase involved in cell wall biosynthesis